MLTFDKDLIPTAYSFSASSKWAVTRLPWISGTETEAKKNFQNIKTDRHTIDHF